MVRFSIFFICLFSFSIINSQIRQLSEREIMEQQNDMQQKFNTNDDKDEDGIPDRYDKCPNETGPLNLFGCPEVNHLDLTAKKSDFDPMDYIKSIEMVSIPGKSWKMSKYEVTISEYLAFCFKTKSHYPEWLDSNSIYYIKGGKNATYIDKRINPAMFDKPITGVSWEDAVAFCNYIGARLPNADEWEYAALAGQNTTFSGSNQLDEYGWSYNNGNLIPQSVGKLKPSPWGIYDMSGNVWEWCENHGRKKGVCKGGSVQNMPWKCRIKNFETHNIQTKRFDIGFRIVMDEK